MRNVMRKNESVVQHVAYRQKSEYAAASKC